ncbi:D-isomer specific 2-hydroxyacid dehydrogenase [Elsinoe ampelina]|uniref:D-3-phosphoglycerate dehydrogenase n=1 Tax=Elsinoe ampelina TaxID=302913 RepID=A0A6A6GFJ1_9PEZI|nr:D-isomer specific 2-hydroxyacid dehydrogenase [Elsinoe ampelina]
MPLIVPTATNGSSARPKVLIPEKVSPDGLALLKGSLDVHEKKGLSPEDLVQCIGDYEALIVRSETKVTAEVLAAGKRLKVVARAGVGVDNVDVTAATKHGIIVVNSPVGNINAAAEHTVALLMAVARNIGPAYESIRAGKWERSKLVGVELKGKNLAIIGLGKVGLTVARIAGGLGMNLTAYDPYANPQLAAAASVTIVPTMAELIKEADFLTIHTPLIASTKGMIGAAELATMKPTARILNVARGGMIDEDALIAALDNNTIAGAGLDVFTSEPPEADSSASRVIAHPKVVATPHLGASTVEAQENVSIDVCTQVLSILSGALPRSAVNAPIILPEEYRTLQPFVSLAENMASIFTQYIARSASTSRSSLEIIYEGTLSSLKTTQPLYAAIVKGLLTPISTKETLNINIVNAELVAKERGIRIAEVRSRETLEGEGYSALITLRARPGPRTPSTSRHRDPLSPPIGSSSGNAEDDDLTISGFVSNNLPYISRLGRFSTSFIPQGTLLMCRNYDEPGKIGVVGGLLGKAGVNIRSMSVAPLERGEGEQGEGRGNEALMILGVDGRVEEGVRGSLEGEEGVVEARVVVL